MNNKVFNIILFTTGAAIGSTVAWFIAKTKYEQIVQEEIDSVKNEYNRLSKLVRNKFGTVTHDDEELNIKYEFEDNESDYNRDLTEDEQDVIEYHKLAGKYHSSCDTDGNYENDEEGDAGDEDEAQYINGPYVICPEDFANNPPGFNAQPLDYFADGILADSWGVQLDIDETIGEDAINHFGEYADDIVYVRNERKELDYEVIKDPRTYEEANRTSPNPYYGQ